MPYGPNTSTYAGGQLITNFDYTRIFVWDNRYISATYTNPAGTTATLVAGQVFGRVSATGKVLPCISTATDGSQVPRFILQNSYTVAGSADQTVMLCFYGGVATNAITLNGSPVDTLTTVIKGNDGTTVFGTYQDVLAANGIFLEGGTENTYVDNQ